MTLATDYPAPLGTLVRGTLPANASAAVPSPYSLLWPTYPEGSTVVVGLELLRSEPGVTEPFPNVPVLGTVARGTLLPGASGIPDFEFRYFADRDFVTGPDDEPANTFFRGSLIQPLTLTSTTLTGQELTGWGGPAVGTVVIANDGNLDQQLINQAFQGFRVIVWLIPPGGLFREAVSLFRGVVVDVDWTRTEARLEIQSRDRDLRSNFQSTFAGTGGSEGEASIRGNFKPRVLGNVRGISPFFIGFVEGIFPNPRPDAFLYYVSDLPCQSIGPVYDGGVMLQEGSGAQDDYQVDLTGPSWIGTQVQAQALTCDVEGYVDPSAGYIETVADCVRQILTWEGVADEDIVQDDFDNLNAVFPAEVGDFYPVEGTTGQAAVERLIEGVTIWAGFNRRNQYQIGQLGRGGTIRAVFDTRINLVDIAQIQGPEVISPPAWRHQLGYGRNYTVTTQFLPAAELSYMEFAQKEFRYEEDNDPAILTRHPQSVTYIIGSSLADESDADTEATRRLELFGGLPEKRLWRLRAWNVAPELDIGDVVEVNAPELGLASRQGTVLQWDINRASLISVVDVYLE